jgi:hypothetical protein
VHLLPTMQPSCMQRCATLHCFFCGTFQALFLLRVGSLGSLQLLSRLIDIDHYGERLTGCPICNVWQDADGIPMPTCAIRYCGAESAEDQ